MADPNGAELRHRTTKAPRSGPNLSGGWIVMLLSGLIAAVLFLFITQQASDRVAVAVLAKDAAPGQRVDASFFRSAEISADGAQLDRLIRFEERERYTGWVAAGPLAAGDFASPSLLREPAASDGQRSMSIPVEKSHAANGQLLAGDRIDVIDPATDDGYVARDVEVLNAVTDSGGIGGDDRFTILVAVSDDEAVAISKAIATGKFDIVRSTGSNNTAAPAASNDEDDDAPTTTTTSSTTTTTTEP